MSQPITTGPDVLDNAFEATAQRSIYEQRIAAAPNLDAGAPRLQSHDMQRLNHRALQFLAGIVMLLIVVTVWMFSGASGERDAGAKPREEKVVVPDLPQAGPPAAAAMPPPIPLAPTQAQAPVGLPPLPPQEAPAVPPSAAIPAMTAPPSHFPTLLERRMDNAPEQSSQDAQMTTYTQAMLAGIPGAAPASPAQPVQAAASSDASSAQFINHPEALLVRGTYIRCVLETRIVTDVPGFTSCVVTEPVYSINGRRLLLPKGSKVSGHYDTAPTGPRIAVIWDRITTPNGFDISMASPAWTASAARDSRATTTRTGAAASRPH